MDFSNQVAIVTGAAHGIGRAVALRLAREGANVVVADVSAERLSEVASEVERLGRRSIVAKVDSGGRSVFCVAGPAGPGSCGRRACLLTRPMPTILPHAHGTLGPARPVDALGRIRWQAAITLLLSRAA